MDDKNLPVNLSATFRIEGGDANNGKISLAAAKSFVSGIASMINQLVHSFLNKGEVRKKNNTVIGASTFISASKKGCFEETIEIQFDPNVADMIGRSVIKNSFWDYLTWCTKNTLGEVCEPTTRYVKELDIENPDLIFEISAYLESYLNSIQHPIRLNKDVTIDLLQMRNEEPILHLNEDTLKYTNGREETAYTEDLEGNITRFNVNTSNGRLYSDEDEKIIPFSLSKANDKAMRGFIVDSMKERVEGEEGKYIFTLTRILSSNQKTKKFIIHNIRKA